jgi:hypothetical protein
MNLGLTKDQTTVLLQKLEEIKALRSIAKSAEEEAELLEDELRRELYLSTS